MLPITQFLEIIKKHGAVGVLAMWLGYTHFEVQDLKDRLYNCLESQVEINRKPFQEKPIEPFKKDTIAFINKKKRKLA